MPSCSALSTSLLALPRSYRGRPTPSGPVIAAIEAGITKFA